ncbi:MAG: glycosyltransferase family 2 protein [Cyanobacteria bacterium SZAS LIN-2]|nr:glycosyltransferase family 2 protein [Cyanobacteria bacterium SZAS LIN-2]
MVSVCLPVYNGERYLDGAIESVLNQTYDNVELIIFDDFSTDHSLEIIESYARQDKRINYWRNGRRMGLYETFNQCLQQAQGEYIKPFSQDDLLRSPALAKLVSNLIIEPSAALVTVGHELIDARSNILKGGSRDVENKMFATRTLIPSSDVLRKCLFPLTNHLGEVSTIMFRSQYQGTGFDSRLTQFADLDYWLRIIMQGDYVAMPETYVFVRHHLGSAAISSARNLMGASDLIKIARKFQRVIEACGATYQEFLDLSIPAYVEQIQEMVADGTIAADRLSQAQDLRAQAALNTTNETAASATAAFSAMATALAGGDVSCLAFTPEPTETASAMLQDLIDFREFSFHAIRLMAKSMLEARTFVVSGAGPETEFIEESEDELYQDMGFDEEDDESMSTEDFDLWSDEPPKSGRLKRINHALSKPLKALKQSIGA